MINLRSKINKMKNLRCKIKKVTHITHIMNFYLLSHQCYKLKELIILKTVKEAIKAIHSCKNSNPIWKNKAAPKLI